MRAVSRLPPEGIIIFAGQIRRLAGLIDATPVDGLPGAWDKSK